MKHLRQLAYNVAQFELKSVIIIGLLIGSVATAIVPSFWYIHFPACLIGCFIAEMTAQHRKYKSTGKY